MKTASLNRTAVTVNVRLFLCVCVSTVPGRDVFRLPCRSRACREQQIDGVCRAPS